MYIGLILLAIAIMIGIIVHQSISDSLEKKLGGFFDGFFATLFIGGIFSVGISFAIAASILQNGNGTLVNVSVSKVMKIEGETTYASIIKDKLSLVHEGKQDFVKFKESLGIVKIVPLKEQETTPYVVSTTYKADSLWTYFSSMESVRHDVHINQNQIKIQYSQEEKVEK